MTTAPVAATQAELAARTPFGLPAGSIRGFLALLICAFVWMVLLLPQQNIKLPQAAQHCAFGGDLRRSPNSAGAFTQSAAQHHT